MALRVGRLAGPDRLVRRAVGRLARAPLRGRTDARAARRALSARRVGTPGRDPLRRDRGFLLGVAVWAGLYGTEAPDRNFAVTFVFVTVWLGFVIVSVLFGDVFRAFNPWRAIARAAVGRLPADRRPGPASRASVSRAAGPLARRDRPARLPLARAGLRRRWRPDRGPDAAHRWRSRPWSTAPTRSSAWPCSGSRGGAPGARRSRSTSGCSPASRRSRSAQGRLAAAVALRRARVGRRARLGRDDPDHDRGDHLRRRAGGPPQRRDR